MKLESFSWSPGKRIVFRFSFVFFALHLVPLSALFWTNLFAQRGNLFFTTFAGLNYFPSFFGNGTYYDARDFILISGSSLLIALIWTLAAHNTTSCTRLYQWTRIALRYKLAAVLFTYAVIKIFSLQLPAPTLSDLNTEYGDFTKARIFELTVGIATAHYQAAVGLTELLAALLLFFRRTATLGALVASGTLLNVVLAAFAYHTGAGYYSLYLILIAAFLIAHDLPAMYSLMIERPAVPENNAFSLNASWTKTRLILKGVFSALAIVYAGSVYSSSGKPYLLPDAAGLSGAAGLYEVSEFRFNNRSIPYSKTDPERWQDVVFEKWNTLSISKKSKSPVETLPISTGPSDRRWESSGSGGRHYFSYSVNDSEKMLSLKNKNSSRKDESYSLRYDRPDNSTIILNGINTRGDSIHAVLKKIDKKYLLIKGRRKPVTL